MMLKNGFSDETKKNKTSKCNPNMIPYAIRQNVGPFSRWHIQFHMDRKEIKINPSRSVTSRFSAREINYIKNMKHFWKTLLF